MMQTKDAINFLTSMHQKCFNEAFLSSKRDNKNISIFSNIGPGCTEISHVKAHRLNIDIKQLSDDLQKELRQFFEQYNHTQKYPLEGDGSGLHAGVIDYFFRSIEQAYYQSAIWDPFHCYGKFLQVAVIQSQQIVDWLEHGTRSRSLCVWLHPTIDFGSGVNIKNKFGNWCLAPKNNNVEKSLTAIELERVSYLDPMFGERIFSSCFFKRDMIGVNENDPEEILTEVDILILSFWLAIGHIFRVQHINFGQTPWNLAPDNRVPFFEPTQNSWENVCNNISSQRFIRPWDRNKLLPMANSIKNEQYERVKLWMEILSSNNGAIYPLNLIRDGQWDIASAVANGRFFTKDRMIQNGIFKIISGMEGLSLACCSRRKNGYFKDCTDTFKKCWKIIWEKAKQNNSTLGTVTHIDESLKKLYSLRSHLAHANSNAADMKEILENIKQNMGDFFGNNQCDIVNVGLNVQRFVDEMLELFLHDRNILSDLLNGCGEFKS